MVEEKTNHHNNIELNHSSVTQQSPTLTQQTPLPQNPQPQQVNLNDQTDASTKANIIEPKSDILSVQLDLITKIKSDNAEIDSVCQAAEKKLKHVDKWVQQRVTLLQETKSNFAYIYDKIGQIRRMEEIVQQRHLMEGHRTYEQIGGAVGDNSPGKIEGSDEAMNMALVMGETTEEVKGRGEGEELLGLSEDNC